MNRNQLIKSQGHFVTGNVVEPVFKKETYRNIETLKSGNKKKTVFAATNYPKLELDLDLLPAAAETYCVSPDPKDYILIPLPLVTVDLPNRNLQGFHRTEILSFAPDQGSMVYQTFNWRPGHLNHDNEDPAIAKGVIVDSAMQYIPRYDVWKINVITLWDRTKDEQMIKEILNNDRNGFSMGAIVNAFICSLCGQIDNQDHHSCVHMKNKGEIYDGKLSWQICTGSVFFECSYIPNYSAPADPTAYSPDVFI